MSDTRSATEVWRDWFDERGRKWFGLGDAGSGRYCECTAAIDCDTPTGERQAFLFQTFEPDGWFMVLDHNTLYHPERPTQVEWIEHCEGRLDAVYLLLEFVASLVPDLADAQFPGLKPSPEIVERMQQIEAENDAIRNALCGGSGS